MKMYALTAENITHLPVLGDSVLWAISLSLVTNNKYFRFNQKYLVYSLPKHFKGWRTDPWCPVTEDNEKHAPGSWRKVDPHPAGRKQSAVNCILQLCRKHIFKQQGCIDSARIKVPPDFSLPLMVKSEAGGREGWGEEGNWGENCQVKWK